LGHRAVFCRAWRAIGKALSRCAAVSGPAPSAACKVLTVFAFSSENWNRPPDEVSGLMELLALALAREVPQLNQGRRPHPVSSASARACRDKMRGLAQAEATAPIPASC
jgi:undecaprenyl pyrophosphate synthase